MLKGMVFDHVKRQKRMKVLGPGLEGYKDILNDDGF